MVEVRFASVVGVEAGIKCTLDGVTKYTDSFGLASFFGISQGAHTYSVEAPDGWKYVSGEDVFGRPLPESGTTVIEWVPYPEIPWPEDQAWMMKFSFEGEDLGEFRFDSYSPPIDTREIFPVGAPWPAVTKLYDPGESVYVHYAVKNIGSAAGGAVITVTDLDEEPVETITTWIIPELSPGQRFKTAGSGAYVGKMPGRNWNLEFKVDP